MPFSDALTEEFHVPRINSIGGCMHVIIVVIIYLNVCDISPFVTHH